MLLQLLDWCPHINNAATTPTNTVTFHTMTQLCVTYMPMYVVYVWLYICAVWTCLLLLIKLLDLFYNVFNQQYMYMAMFKPYASLSTLWGFIIVPLTTSYTLYQPLVLP